jgi:hypothetical protein
VSLLVRVVRARLLKAIDGGTLEEALEKIDDAGDGLDTIIEMTALPPAQDAQDDNA